MPNTYTTLSLVELKDKLADLETRKLAIEKILAGGERPGSRLKKISDAKVLKIIGIPLLGSVVLMSAGAAVSFLKYTIGSMMMMLGGLFFLLSSMTRNMRRLDEINADFLNSVKADYSHQVHELKAEIIIIKEIIQHLEPASLSPCGISSSTRQALPLTFSSFRNNDSHHKGGKKLGRVATPTRSAPG